VGATRLPTSLGGRVAELGWGVAERPGDRATGASGLLSELDRAGPSDGGIELG